MSNGVLNIINRCANVLGHNAQCFTNQGGNKILTSQSASLLVYLNIKIIKAHPYAKKQDEDFYGLER